MKRIIAVIVLLSLTASVGVLIDHLSERRDSVQNLTIAVSAQSLTAPIYIAREKGFFEQEGLHVTLQPHIAGVDALNAVIGGHAQFGTVADTPLMLAGFKGEKIYVVATIGNSKGYVKIVARRDRGIAEPQDLRDKRIGVRMGTSSEYFLYAYLTFNGIRKESVNMVDVKLEYMENALASGEIDAAVAWDPYRSSMNKRLRNNAVTLSNRFIYDLDWNIVGRSDFIRDNPQTVSKLLRAIIKATDYLDENPNEARRITARSLGREGVTLAGSTFDVHLGQSLLVNLESQARWAIDSGLTDKRQVPDFLPMMYPEGLEAVKPEAVTLIHD